MWHSATMENTNAPERFKRENLLAEKLDEATHVPALF
jgi:hypothetical protein